MIDSFSPEDFAQGVKATKSFFDTARSVVGLLKDARDVLPESEGKDRASRALAEAEKAAALAEAQLATAFGYQLCRQHFPPIVMLEVGYKRDGQRVSECPICGNDTAKPFTYTRTAAPRAEPNDSNANTTA